jgi:hypothetical protein
VSPEHVEGPNFEVIVPDLAHLRTEEDARFMMPRIAEACVPKLDEGMK